MAAETSPDFTQAQVIQFTDVKAGQPDLRATAPNIHGYVEPMATDDYYERFMKMELKKKEEAVTSLRIVDPESWLNAPVLIRDPDGAVNSYDPTTWARVYEEAVNREEDFRDQDDFVRWMKSRLAECGAVLPCGRPTPRQTEGP